MNSYGATCLAAALAAGVIGMSAVARSATAQIAADTRASASRAVPAASGQLQGLTRATTKQLEIAFRHDEEEHEKRREQLAAAVAAWRAASRSAANDKLLADWLRVAIRKSMPGSREALPAVPNFDRPVAAAPRPAATTALSSKPAPSSTMRQKPVAENLDSAHVPVPSSSAAQAAPSQTTTADANAGDEDDRVQDFWTAHPANSDLPAELSGGDPFGDDP